MIFRLCLNCHKRIKPGSKLKIYCQGHIEDSGGLVKNGKTLAPRYRCPPSTDQTPIVLEDKVCLNGLS